MREEACERVVGDNIAKATCVLGERKGDRRRGCELGHGRFVDKGIGYHIGKGMVGSDRCGLG